MKVRLLTIISFLTYQFSISQTEKLLHGKVLSNNYPIEKVEVINKTAKTSTRTNYMGEFSILVQPNDSLLFFSKNYFFTRIKINSQNIAQDNIWVNMIIKPEELKEVVITSLKFDKIKFDQGAINNIDVLKRANDLTRSIPGYKDGTITNGMSVSFALGSGKPKEKMETMSLFKKLIAASIPSSFFTQELKLKPEEKDLFIDFCDADPRSKGIIENNNILTTMDFLYAKNEMFKKAKLEPLN